MLYMCILQNSGRYDKLFDLRKFVWFSYLVTSFLKTTEEKHMFGDGENRSLVTQSLIIKENMK